MNKLFVTLTVLAIAVVAVVGVLFVLSLPQFSANAAFLASSTAVPTSMSGTQYPTAASTGIANTGGTTQYVVQAGDSMSTIAASYNITLAALIAANPQISNPNVIFPGQVLRIPIGSSTPVPTTGGNPTSIPNTGGSSTTIPNTGGPTANVPTVAITPMTPNAGGNATSIPNTGGYATSIPNVGTTPVIPNTGSTPTSVPNANSSTAGGFYYVVQQGDSLNSIASKYGVSLQALTNANPSLLQPGQVIFVPNGSNSGPGVPPTGGGSTYVVQTGDTLGSIAQRYNTTVNAILGVNPQIINPNLIFPGQVIQLPGGVSIPPTGGTGNTYVVQSGDTMGAIAARFGVSLQALLSANPAVTNPNFILPGQVLTIPSGSSIPPTGGNGTYTVVAGDTLFNIATTRGISLQALLNANPQITNPNLIFPGQVINLP